MIWKNKIWWKEKGTWYINPILAIGSLIGIPMLSLYLLYKGFVEIVLGIFIALVILWLIPIIKEN
jgi:hypothetical protein